MESRSETKRLALQGAKLYTQSELDEAVAGAYLAAAGLVPKCADGYACKSINPKWSTYCPNCRTTNAILALTPADAKAAWERRDANLKHELEVQRQIAGNECRERLKVIAEIDGVETRYSKNLAERAATIERLTAELADAKREDGTPCPRDGKHCRHWYAGGECCVCGKSAVPIDAAKGGQS